MYAVGRAAGDAEAGAQLELTKGKVTAIIFSKGNGCSKLSF